MAEAPADGAISSMWDSGTLAMAPHEEWHAARRRYDAVRGFVEGGLVLDLGTGTGWLARSLELDGLSTVAADISPTALAAARRLGTVRLVAVAAENLPFRAATFDAVVTLEMLEHTQDPRAALAECHRVLRSGGRLVVTVPNALGLYSLLVDKPMRVISERPKLRRLTAKLLPSQYLRDRFGDHSRHDIRLHHEYAFARQDWEALFKEADFDLVHRAVTEVVSPVVGIVLRIVFARSHDRFVKAMGRVGRLDERLVDRIPLSLASGWAFSLTRR